MTNFIEILQLKEYYLHNYLVKLLNSYDYDVIDNELYIYANCDESTSDVCLTAHLDTVWALTPEDSELFYDDEKDMLWGINGIGADDRAGVYIIIKLLELGHRPKGIIFTHNEEFGGIGAKCLVDDFMYPRNKYKYIIELDRQGLNDCVFYGCNNREFEEYINSFGWETAFGTMSDISIIAPKWGIAAVNLSTGYFDEHTYCERVKPKYIINCIIPRVEKMLVNAETASKFKYIKRTKFNNRYVSYPAMVPKFIESKDCYYCGRRLDNFNQYFMDNLENSFFICPCCKEKHHPDPSKKV